MTVKPGSGSESDSVNDDDDDDEHDIYLGGRSHSIVPRNKGLRVAHSMTGHTMMRPCKEKRCFGCSVDTL